MLHCFLFWFPRICFYVEESGSKEPFTIQNLTLSSLSDVPRIAVITIKGCKMSILNLCVWDLYMLTIWMLKTRVLRVLEFLYQNWNLHEIYFWSWHLWSPFTREIFLRWQFVKTFQKFKLRTRNCAHRSPCKTSCFMVRKPQIDKVNSWTLSQVAAS